MKDDGTMARMPDLEKFAEEHNLKIAAVRDLIRYHLRHGQLGVRRVAETKLPSRYGNFTMIAYENDISADTHVAIVKGDVSEKGGPDPVLVRVHSECLTGDAFGSLRCDCGQQLASALTQIHREGRGVLLYMRQEGRGIGLACPEKHELCCYIGEEAQVRKAMEGLALRVAKEKASPDEAFTDNVIMYEVLSELKDIAGRGGISCACGSHEYTMQVRRGAVDLTCAKCGGRLRLPAATDSDLDDLCCRMTLTIPGR